MLSLLVSLLITMSLVGGFQHIKPNTKISCLMMGGGAIRGDTIPTLLSLIEETQRGSLSTNKVEILACLDEISSKNERFLRPELCAGKWELLYTTEKETLFFAKNGLFGSKCTSISQTIDFSTKKINNLIQFDNDKEFSVIGDISRDNNIKNRVNFKFSSASLRFNSKFAVNIPPIGQGWFDNLFINNMYRISYDVRGDYLLSKRIL